MGRRSGLRRKQSRTSEMMGGGGEVGDIIRESG